MQITGLKNGALLQRDENDFSSVTLKASFEGLPRVSHGELACITENTYRFTGLPVGGPYEVTFSDDASSMTFTDLYVGDLWLLAGQSNMEGAGRTTQEDVAYAASPLPVIRAFYMDDHWDAAVPVLHRLSLSPDPAHRKAVEAHEESIKERKLTILDNPPNPPIRAVGPGLFFAKELYRLTGVPQGVIPAAVGGAPIEMWLPPEEGVDNYYTASLRRLRETGNHIRGVFWAQGEGNPHPEIYPAQIETIRRDLASQLGMDALLPFVQMQSCRLTLDFSLETSFVWSNFREMQRKMPLSAEKLATIATNDLELDDCIHISSDSHKLAGVRAANAMHRLITGEGLPEPDLERVYTTPDTCVPDAVTALHIRYHNVSGALTSAGAPFGFTIKKKGNDGEPTMYRFQRILLSGDEIIIRIELSRAELRDYALWYGFGNQYYCNITDASGRAIPSMGPIDLAEYLD